MRIQKVRRALFVLAAAGICGLLGGCDSDDEDKRLRNETPGINDVNVIVCFGDSITLGSECACVPYPARLAVLTGKTVHNAGIGGSRIASGLARLQGTINRYHPGFMFILYGVNDIIHGANVAGITGPLIQMVAVCKQNNVVPVLLTYPQPILGHKLFAGGTLSLNRTIRTLAETNELKCVDLEVEFALPTEDADDTAPRIPDPLLYRPDGLHPNDAGSQIIAAACADLF